MTVALAVAATFLVVRQLADEAEAELDQDLLRRAVIAEAHVRDIRLSLVDGARLVANLSGMSEAIVEGDDGAARRLLASAAAARSDIELLVVTDVGGEGLVEVRRDDEGLAVDSGGDWSRALDDDDGTRVVDAPAGVSSAFIEDAARSVLAVAVPVTLQGGVVGASLVGISVDTLAAGATERAGAAVAFFAADGSVLNTAAAGAADVPVASFDTPVRLRSADDGTSKSTLYASVDLDGERIASLAVSLPTDPAFAGVRGARTRLILLLLAATTGIVALGALIARGILRQVRPFVATNQALGRGDLDARVPVYGDDELAELARGFNQMVEQLAASQKEIDLQVQTRTEELARLAEDLQLVDHTRSREFAEIVHELRNHVLVVSTYADFMTNPDLAPRSTGWAKTYGLAISDAASALNRQVDHILELAKRRASETQLQLEAVGLGDVLRDMEPTISALARRGDLEAEVDVAPGLPAIRADRVRLGQILLNLVSNAVKYTPPGGRLRVEASRAPATTSLVQIHVEDTGLGIAPEVGDDIFQPFYRTQRVEGVDQPAGTGIGLAVVKRLVEQHGGSIRYQSRVGEGSRFTVTLPTIATKRKGRRAPDRPRHRQMSSP